MVLLCLAAIVGGIVTVVAGAPFIGLLPALLLAPFVASFVGAVTMLAVAYGPRVPPASGRGRRPRQSRCLPRVASA